MEIAILLPVFNNLDFTKSTLEELGKLLPLVEGSDFHIVIVDDGSTDGTSDWVQQNHPEVILLHGDGNLWWSGAINMGAQYAIEKLKVDYLLLWNNDVKVVGDYFKELVRIVSETTMPALLGSKIYVAEQPELVWSMGGYFDPKSGRYDMYGNFENDSEGFREIREADWLTGMGTVVPVEVVEQIGNWNAEDFPQYHGDSDFTYRAKLAGYRVFVHPSLGILNHVRSSGIDHEGSIRRLMMLLTDIRSKSNLKKNLKFYRLYSNSLRAYWPVVWFYFQIFGGFMKWKILRIFGIKKKTSY
jgi:GT2 family glycosyltransferase